MLFGYGTVSTQAALLTEILTSSGYSEDFSTIFGATALASGLIFSVIYSILWINARNQLGILVYVIILEIIFY
jgi:hypothetical protein